MGFPVKIVPSSNSMTQISRQKKRIDDEPLNFGAVVSPNKPVFYGMERPPSPPGATFHSFSAGAFAKLRPGDTVILADNKQGSYPTPAPHEVIHVPSSKLTSTLADGGWKTSFT